MKSNKSSSIQSGKSTYALLMRSEKEDKNVFETIACSVFILSAVVAIFQFASQPVKLMNDPVRTVSTAQVQAVSQS